MPVQDDVRSVGRVRRATAVGLAGAAMLLAASCGSESIAAVERPAPVEPSAEVEGASSIPEPDGQLSDFFGPTTAGAADLGESVEASDAVDDSTEPDGQLSDFFGPTTTDDADPVESDSSTPDLDESQTSAASAESEVVAPPTSMSLDAASGERIVLTSRLALRYGEHTVEVQGTGFRSGADVIVVFCVIPGDPLEQGVGRRTLVTRLSELTPSEDCDVARAITLISSDDGDFLTDITGEVEPNSLIYAADISSTTGAYAILPGVL